MRASQEIRWKQRIRENEERRRRYEEASRRIEEEQKTQAQRALELRRQERQRMDELMRNPAQPPAPPKKQILRRGARTKSSPVHGGVLATDDVDSNSAAQKVEHDRHRREWSEGLKQYISRQRQAAKGASDKDEADALSWQELKMAAEAGFEELLKNQEAAAAEQVSQGTWRRPGMSRPKGGTPYNIAAAAGAPGESVMQAGMTPPMSPSPPAVASPAAYAVASSIAGSNGSSPTSKWAARMKHMLDRAMEDAPAATSHEPAAVVTAAPGSMSALGREQGSTESGMGAAQEGTDDAEAASVSHEQPGAHGPAADEQQGPVETAVHQQDQARALLPGPLVVDSSLPAIASGGYSPRPAAELEADPSSEDASGSRQHMPAAAQLTADALRASMEKLHKATEVMRSSMQLSPKPPAVRMDGSILAAKVSPWSPVRHSRQLHQQQQELRGSWAEHQHQQTQMQGGGWQSAQQQEQPAEPAEGLESPQPQDNSSVASSDNSRSVSPARSSAARNADAEQHSPASEHPSSPTRSHAMSRTSSAAASLQASVEQPLPGHGYAIAQATGSPQAANMQEPEKSFPVQVVPSAADTVAGQQLRTEQPLMLPQQQQQQQERGMQLPAALSVGQPAAPAQAAVNSAELAQSGKPSIESPAAAAAPASPAAAAEVASSEGPTLDSLLVEVQQLAQLRKALKAELTAMGQEHIVEAMGTLRLSTDAQLMSLASTLQQQQLQELQQQLQHTEQQNDQPAQSEQLHEASVEANIVAMQGHWQAMAEGQQQEQTNNKHHHQQHLSAVSAATAAPASQQRAGLPPGLAEAASPRQADQQRIVQQQHQQSVPPAVATQPAVTVRRPASARQQQQQQQQQHQLEHQVQENGQLLKVSQQEELPHRQQQQLPRQQQQHHQQQQRPVVQGSQPSTAAGHDASPSATTAMGAAPAGRASMQLLDTRVPKQDGTPSLSDTVAQTMSDTVAQGISTEAMDMSFSFGHGSVPQQSVEIPAQQSAGSQSVTGQQLRSSVNLRLQPQAADLQQLTSPSTQAAPATPWQQQLPWSQQQQPLWGQQPQQQLQQAWPQQQVQEWQQHPPPQLQPAARPADATAATAVQIPSVQSAVQPMLNWRVPGVQASSMPAGAPRAFMPGVPNLQQLSIPNQSPYATPYGTPPVMSPTVAAVAAQLAPAGRAVSQPPPLPPAAAAPAQHSHNSSKPSSPQPSAVSRWVSNSPTSRKRVSSSGVAGAGAQVLSVNPGTGHSGAQSMPGTGNSSPTGSVASVRSGSSFLAKLTKQASKGRTSAKPAQSSGGTPAAERPLSNQGSYLAAALAAKKRLEKEQAEREQVEAAAAAAKAAAAKRAQEQHRLDAQQAAAAKAAHQQVLPVAIGSYAQHTTADQQRTDSLSEAQQTITQHTQRGQQPTTPQDTGQSPETGNKHVSGQRGAISAHKPSPGSSKRARVTPPGTRQPTPTTSAAASRSVTPLRAPPSAVAATAAEAAPHSRLTSPNVTPPASRIPSAPGTPSAKKAMPGPNTAAVTPHGASSRPAHARANDNALLDSFDSDFDYLERDTASDPPQTQQAGRYALAASAVAANGAKGQGSAQLQAQVPSALVLQQDFSNHHPDSASSQQQNMWAAVQAAAAAAANRNAAASTPLQAGQLGVVRPSGVRTPEAVTHTSLTPRSVAAAGGAARLSTAATGLGQAAAPAGGSTSSQQHRPDGAGALTLPNGYSRPKLSPIAPYIKHKSAAAAPKELTSSQQLALEEQALLQSLQQLDARQAQTRQPSAVRPTAAQEPRQGVTTPPAAMQAARQQLAAATKAANAGVKQLTPQQQQKLQSSLEALDARLAAIRADSDQSVAGNPAAASSTTAKGPVRNAAGAAGKLISNTTKAVVPSPNKAKEQRNNKLAAARSPGSVVITPAAESPTKQAVAAQPGAATGVVGAGSTPWPGQWPMMPGSFMPPPMGQPMPMQMMQQGPNFAPAGFGPPSMAWQEPQLQGSPQTVRGLDRHAAAALAAAAPVHLQQQPAGIVPAPFTAMAPGSPYGPPFWQQQMQPGGMPPQYWAAMQQAQQTQQYQPWQQQPMGVAYPASAGTMGVGGLSRPGSGWVQQNPPNSAPTAYMPGSPLLPTLHYQQTIMRNRTSTSGDDMSDADGRVQPAGWHQATRGQAGEANVWPPRGVEKTVASTKPATGRRVGDQQETGSIRVYKPGLLL